MPVFSWVYFPVLAHARPFFAIRTVSLPDLQRGICKMRKPGLRFAICGGASALKRGFCRLNLKTGLHPSGMAIAQYVLDRLRSDVCFGEFNATAGDLT
ncbi:MAG: hypothetical protein AAFW47_06485 [Pseudomonadota bacterium]